MKGISSQRRDRAADNLPWDVVLVILEMVPAKRLPVFLLACQAFRRIGETILYRHIDLTDSPIRSILLFRTLIASPYLASLVRTFQVAEHVPSLGTVARLFYRFRSDRTPSQWQRVCDLSSVGDMVCRSLKNVEAIAVRRSEDDLRATYPHVTKIRFLHALRGRAGDNSYLASLPDLTHLELPTISVYSYSSIPHIPPTHYPELQELVAPTFVASQIVPNRPVERLFLTLPLLWEPDRFDEIMATMQRSTRKIRVLGLVLGVAMLEIGEVLDAVGKFLNDVEELCVRSRIRRPSPDDSITLFVQPLTDFLSLQPSLRVLDLNGCGGGDRMQFRNRHQLALSRSYKEALRTWKSICPPLERVVFPNGSIWVWREVTAEWRCLNGWTPGRNRMKRGRMTYVQGAEPWTKPVFGSDLKRKWPDEVVAELKRFIPKSPTTESFS